jgi:hypothetical protein
VTAHRLSRRQLAWLALVASFSREVPSALAQTPTASVAWSYPVAEPGGIPGDGCGIFHGYACENTVYYPGLWHTGENWYRVEGDSAGLQVLAVADGIVRYAGSDYPGLVIIIEHAGGLFSMYGHLNFESPVAEGDRITRGTQIGTILARPDGRPSHLHFEIRTFYEAAEVNGDTPRHQWNCGYQCPPGPGYWPMNDPDHPSVMGWRNPTSVIGTSPVVSGAEVVVTATAGTSLSTWDRPGVGRGDDLVVAARDRFPLLEIDPGDPASTETSARGYHLWYRLNLPGGARWVQAAVPSDRFTNSDGRPASVRLRLVQVV